MYLMSYLKMCAMSITEVVFLITLCFPGLHISGEAHRVQGGSVRPLRSVAGRERQV